MFKPGQWVQLGIAEPQTDALVGDIGLHLSADSQTGEVGSTLAPSAQGCGVARAAVQEALQLFFTSTEVSRIFGITAARNTPSIRLLERLSSEEALRRAFWTVKFPSLGVFLIFVSASIGLSYFNCLSGIWILPGLAMSIVGSWLVWSVQIPRWRLWTYRQVSDIRLLKALAMQRQYIWDDESIFTKTEIMSKQVRDELRSLEERSTHGTRRFAGGNSHCAFKFDDEMTLQAGVLETV